MSEAEDAIIATKLDILIGDFQRYRDEQALSYAKINVQFEKDYILQRTILTTIMKTETTLTWHTVIGSAMVAAITGIVFYLAGGKSI